MKIHYGLILFLLTGSLPILAQSAARYEAHYFTGATGDTLPYRILFPEGYGANGQDYPLLLFLHGSGERGDDNEAQLIHGARTLADSLVRYPAVLVFPQCTKDGYWADVERTDTGREYPLYEKANPDI